jgi:hypothetical protein
MIWGKWFDGGASGVNESESMYDFATIKRVLINVSVVSPIRQSLIILDALFWQNCN